jgi:hypothetical protein
MISVHTVPMERMKDGPYRSTLTLDKVAQLPRAFGLFENLFANLMDRVKAGHTLSIHVAHFSDYYLVLDGHICADVYRYMGVKEVAVIQHEEITTATAALEAYVAFNYLRADWRDSVDLMTPLSNLANLNGVDSAVKLMNDPESAVDLIKLHRRKWWEFNSVEERIIPVLDDLLEDLPNTNDKKLRGATQLASILIHQAEAHRKPSRKSVREAKAKAEAEGIADLDDLL